MKLSRLIRHSLAPAWLLRNKLPATALDRIERTIRESEARHAGQIRFVVEHALEPGAIWCGQTAGDRALQVFSLLRVWDTEHNNGVLESVSRHLEKHFPGSARTANELPDRPVVL